MVIKLDRRYKKETYTLSRVYIDEVRFGDGNRFCSILEDTDRNLNNTDSLQSIKQRKIYGKTAIPRGKYQIAITYSNRFKKPLPLVLNVPGWEGVRIHPGNTDAHTEGCLLPGENLAVGKVLNSRYWFSKLYDKIKKALDAGDKVTLIIE